MNGFLGNLREPPVSIVRIGLHGNIPTQKSESLLAEHPFKDAKKRMFSDGILREGNEVKEKGEGSLSRLIVPIEMWETCSKEATD